MAGLRYYDGRRAAGQGATARLDHEALVIADSEGATLAHWPLARLRGRFDTGPDETLLLYLPGDEARALVADPELAAAIRAACPALLGHTPDPAARRRALIVGGATLAVLAAMIFGLLPVLANRMAPLIPQESEAAFGRVVVTQATRFFGVEDEEAPFCTGPEGRAALDRLVVRLTGAMPLPYRTLSVEVADGDLVNAFAAPGGQVVLFRGLIEAADTPDELAGVLAHEFGHVAAHDPTRLALRAAGTAGLLGLLFGDFTGGTVVLTLGNRMISAGYTREAEAAADTYALAMLEGAGISPRGFGDFFARMAAESGDRPALAGLLDTHPDPGRRAEAARAADTGSATPALTGPEWAALHAICD